MKNQRPSARPLSPRKLFEQKLSAYSVTHAAALVTSLGAVGATATASAQTIHTLTTFSLDGGTTFTTTPPDAAAVHNATTVFLGFVAADAAHAAGFSGRFYAYAYQSNARVRIANGQGSLSTDLRYPAYKLALGAPISHAGGLLHDRRSFYLAVRGNAGIGGAFDKTYVPNAAVSGYIGFKNQRNGNDYYGWLRVKVTNNANGSPAAVTLVDTNTPGIYGAYASAGSGITAGQISAIPEPASVATGLALFALGAVGVREHRRRRKFAA